MIMSAGLRKFVLTVHVVSSVGWLGAVLAFVGLALTASFSPDGQTVRGALLVMEPVGWYVLLPLVILSLLTGIIQGLGSVWGLVRHYWVLFKLVIASVSTYVFVAFLLTTLDPAISGAADPATSVERLQALAGTPRSHALLALAGLVTASVLAVYKPRGVTRYGRRWLEKQRGRRRAEVTVPELAMSAVAAGRDRVGEGTGSAGVPGSRPGRGDDRGAGAGNGGRRWLKAAGFILGVVVWALLLRIVLGTDASDAGGGHEPAGGNPGGTEQRQEPGPGGHVPPPGSPGHGG